MHEKCREKGRSLRVICQWLVGGRRWAGTAIQIEGAESTRTQLPANSGTRHIGARMPHVCDPVVLACGARMVGRHAGMREVGFGEG
jgi:hypothetical protein